MKRTMFVTLLASLLLLAIASAHSSAQIKMEDFRSISLTLGQTEAPENISLVSLGLAYTGSGILLLNHQIGIHHIFSMTEGPEMYGFIFFDLGTLYRIGRFRGTAFAGPAIVYTNTFDKSKGSDVKGSPRFGVGPNVKVSVSYIVIRNFSFGAEYCYNISRLGSLHGVQILLAISNDK